MGPPGLPSFRNLMHAVVSDSGEADAIRPTVNDHIHIDFHYLNSVILPDYHTFEAQSLQPYGLRPACLRPYA